MLFCYHLPPIDFWAGALTAQAMLASVQDWEAHAEPLAGFAARLAALEKDARDGFKQVGWEGDTSAGPYFFCLPDENLEFGCMLKQSNNGSTFVASPRPLPWLESLAMAPPYLHRIRRSA